MTEPTQHRTPREKLEDGYEHARDAANDALAKTRTKARQAARKAGDEVEDFPLAVLAGGAALGAVIGAVIPASLRERKMLGSAGKRLNAAAVAAAGAAREAGRQELDSLGLTRESAGREANRLLEGVVKAAGNAGSAAAKAARDKAKAG